MPPDHEEDAESVQAAMKLERGGKVSISNRFGVITVKGYDGDTVQAKAISMEGDTLDAKTPLIKGDSQRMRVAMEGVAGRRHGRGADLQISVPRYAAIEIVDSQETDVEVGDLEGSVTIAQGSGDVNVHQVGALNVGGWQRGDVLAHDINGRCAINVFTGDITIDNVKGSVDVSSISGELRITNVGESVKANAVSGEVVIHCVKGRVDAKAVSGSIELVGVKGDVDSETVSGENLFKGTLREGGNYRLKSMSGEVAMHLPSDAPGFTVTMTTFSGELETAFPIKVESAVQQNEITRRLIGRYGNGQAKISLDSFSAGARLAQATAAELPVCK
ncbi:MAG: DUF4097 family beta strand repeat protein [Acidobacteria bacterium]|nr:DUF4097 family beta strand repeat protein [Acidobacteriota bacterium]